MPDDIELNVVNFVTIGTIGEPGNRTFHLQAKQDDLLVTFTVEKEQAQALAEGIEELLREVASEFEQDTPEAEFEEREMDLLEPIQPVFRLAQMQLGYDNSRDLVLLIAAELLLEDNPNEPRMLRMGMSRRQAQTLAKHTKQVVSRGRAKPEQNGYRMHY